MSRHRFFRGIRVELECGHEEVLPTSWFRLTAALVAVIAGHYVRTGVRCKQCHAVCQIQSIRGTTRL